jgi:hypothetical protein
MKHYIDTKKPGCFFLKRRVTAIAQDGAPTGEKEHENLQTLYNNSGRHGEQPKQPKALKVISVNANGDNAIEHRYSHVICTVPITCLRYSIDHSGCELSDTQKNAIRQVQYTPAVKVGVKFKSAWWTFKEPGNYPQIGIIGGQSFTDLPIRTVVYPSYGISGDRNLVRNLATLEGGARTAAITSIKTKASRPAVLIASYVRTNDAATFGSLIPPHPGPVGAGKTEVKDLVLRNLADIHNVELAFLQERYLDLYAYDFSENNRSMGGFFSSSLLITLLIILV